MFYRVTVISLLRYHYHFFAPPRYCDKSVYPDWLHRIQVKVKVIWKIDNNPLQPKEIDTSNCYQRILFSCLLEAFLILSHRKYKKSPLNSYCPLSFLISLNSTTTFEPYIEETSILQLKNKELTFTDQNNIKIKGQGKIWLHYTESVNIRFS